MILRPFLTVLVFACDPALASLNMQEGLWETTLTADGRTQPAGTNCYTRADIEEMERLFEGRPSRGDGACHYSGFTRTGDTITYTMTCRVGDDEQTSAVTATYRGDSASGTIRANGVTVAASSRRIGECTVSSFVR
jgi:hypothetical protein